MLQIPGLSLINELFVTDLMKESFLMLRRKQFELFTYFVIELWIIRALSADLAAYSVVYSSSPFSLVLLITTIITKK